MDMEALITLRTKWAAVKAEETRLLRAMTVSDGLRELTMLYTAYRSNLEADAAEQAERTAALLERQRRLMQLATWLRLHPMALVETGL
jgi:hypothetical protein